MDTQLDRILIRDLRVRGIVGINPEERINRQDILVNIIIWADTRPAAASDNIDHAVNYKTISQAIIEHIEQAEALLVEKLAADLVALCFKADTRIQAVELSVEKPEALPLARSVGVSIFRQREEIMGF